MKTKDLISLAVASAMLVGAVVILIGTLSGKPAGPRQANAEVIAPISADFSQSALQAIADQTKVRDFGVTVDLTGLGNANPFD